MPRGLHQKPLASTPTANPDIERPSRSRCDVGATVAGPKRARDDVSPAGDAPRCALGRCHNGGAAGLSYGVEDRSLPTPDEVQAAAIFATQALGASGKEAIGRIGFHQ